MVLSIHEITFTTRNWWGGENGQRGIHFCGVFPTEGQSVPVLDRVSLTVNPRECLAILGASGSGKSTLLRAIFGLVKPTKGTISLEGVDLAPLPPPRRNAALVFQNGGWYDHLKRCRSF